MPSKANTNTFSVSVNVQESSCNALYKQETIVYEYFKSLDGTILKLPVKIIYY
jgi:hypothetical protein